MKGARIRLNPAEPLLIGRSNRGLHLPDTSVSPQHAQISWVDGRYVVTDLGSGGGTWVGNTPLETGGSTEIDVGTIIRVGTTRLEVHRFRDLRLAKMLGGGGAGVLFVALVVGLLVRLSTLQDAGVRLSLPDGVHRGPGRKPVDSVAVPDTFLRRHGLVASTLTIRKVTDLNNDQIDEIWLRGPTGEYLITFDDAANWSVIGELPLGCEERVTRYESGKKAGWPELRCEGEHWAFEDGRFQAIAQEGVVVWIDPRTTPPPKPEPVKTKAKRGLKLGKAEPVPAPAPVVIPPYEGVLQPIRVALVHLERFGAFLAARQIDEPIHYLVCEGAIEGIPAQVRTATGEQIRLPTGCLADLGWEGDVPGDVRMVAFTAAGRVALLHDIAATWGGTADGLWLDERHQGLLDKISGDPGLMLGASRLSAIPADPVPWGPPAELPLPVVRLVPSIGTAEPLATSATLLTAGRVELDPPGCAVLTVDVHEWKCRISRGCLPGSQFLQVNETGCGAPKPLLVVPYATGTYDSVGDLDLRVSIASRSLVEGSEVVQARIGYQPLELSNPEGVAPPAP
jgi:hypothetical protein